MKHLAFSYRHTPALRDTLVAHETNSRTVRGLLSFSHDRPAIAVNTRDGFERAHSRAVNYPPNEFERKARSEEATVYV